MKDVRPTGIWIAVYNGIFVTIPLPMYTDNQHCNILMRSEEHVTRLPLMKVNNTATEEIQMFPNEVNLCACLVYWRDVMLLTVTIKFKEVICFCPDFVCKQEPTSS